MNILSVIVPWLYLAVPVAAALWAGLRVRRSKSWRPMREVLVACIAGVIFGLTLVAVYAAVLHTRISPVQAAVACYWAMSVIYILRGFNAALTWGVGKATGAKPGRTACCPAAEMAGVFARALLLLCVGIPYVMSVLLVYRPKIVHPGTPVSLMSAAYQDVAFSAADGTRLRGWWIPAEQFDQSGRRRGSALWGRKTVVLCHGFGADKASGLKLVRDLVPNGYNVLAFDFRAHGQSDGQLSTFGDLERRDVLAAVRWVRANRAAESERIFGLGESLGSAALISAAADPGPDGQAIDAVAVYEPYDDLAGFLRDVALTHYAPVGGWVSTHVLLPIAGALLGADLVHFSPAHDVQALWPRPILVIGRDGRSPVDVPRSEEVYWRAMQPKQPYFVEPDHEHHRAVKPPTDEDTSRAVRAFFDGARSIL